jgi:hypothetical protein
MRNPRSRPGARDGFRNSLAGDDRNITRTPLEKQAARSRARYARAAVYAEFGRHGRALDYGNFRDRRPCDQPKRSARWWP